MGVWDTLRKSDRNRTRLEQMYEDAYALCNSSTRQNETLGPQERQRVENGVACEQIANGTGEFGRTVTNPIPVNGLFGAWTYLSRLRWMQTGSKVFFHQLRQEGSIMVFALINRSGTWQDTLYVDPYHPYASRHRPKGYMLEKEFVFPRGVTTHIVAFPQGLYRHIQQEAKRRLGIALADEEGKYIQVEKTIYP